jgi:AdoMet-dependent heme synthase
MSVDGPVHEPESPNLFNGILAETQKRRRLVSAHWELTYRCNEKCSHCYLDVFAPHADVPGELTTGECFHVLDELESMGVLNLTLSGGEILVRRDFFEIAEYAHSKRFLLRLFTNGIMIDPGVADRIAALHPYAVELSVYGARSETHDGITQLKHSWELTLRALRLLRERGVRTVMKTPLMRENLREFDDLELLAKEVGAQFHFDITITPKDNGGLSPLAHCVTYQELVEFMRGHIDPALWVGRTVADDSRTCAISLNAIAIDPYGNVFPCLQTRFNAGNLRERRLSEIWGRSPVWEEVGHLTVSELPVCRTCELRSLCVRCHGLALAETGDLRAPAAANCREALARRQALVDRGDLPADFPIPAHLKGFDRDHRAASEPGETVGNFIPLSALFADRRRATADVAASGLGEST